MAPGWHSEAGTEAASRSGPHGETLPQTRPTRHSVVRTYQSSSLGSNRFDTNGDGHVVPDQLGPGDVFVPVDAEVTPIQDYAGLEGDALVALTVLGNAEILAGKNDRLRMAFYRQDATHVHRAVGRGEPGALEGHLGIFAHRE